MKRYEGEHIEVTYDTARCLHAAECVRGLPAVFDTAKRPWIVRVTDQHLNRDCPGEQVRRDSTTMSTGRAEHEHWSGRHLAAPRSSQRSNSETRSLGHAPSHGMLPSLNRAAIAWP